MIRARLSYLQYRMKKLPEKFTMTVAWRLPKQLAYWAAIRVMAHATTGSYSNQVVPELLAMDALERWNDPTGGDLRVGQQASR
jgi:hypothetical protein